MRDVKSFTRENDVIRVYLFMRRCGCVFIHSIVGVRNACIGNYSFIEM